MGMYDTICIKCNNCGKNLELQTKAANMPGLNKYVLNKVPADIAGYIIGESIQCNCGWKVIIHGSIQLWPEWIHDFEYKKEK